MNSVEHKWWNLQHTALQNYNDNFIETTMTPQWVISYSHGDNQYIKK